MTAQHAAAVMRAHGGHEHGDSSAHSGGSMHGGCERDDGLLVEKKRTDVIRNLWAVAVMGTFFLTPWISEFLEYSTCSKSMDLETDRWIS